MSKELKKRIITSILLISVVLFCIFTNRQIYIAFIFLISFIVFLEINRLIFLIKKKAKKVKIFPLRLLTFFFIFFIFLPATVNLYKFGQIYITYILLVCALSDIGGYVVGKNIGGKKLTKISPNKTISGSFGSLIFSTIPFLILNNTDKIIFSNFYENFLLCLKISIICQLGDLFISYIKRKAKVKNTGKILPGHGGLLDRIDGIIFAMPFVWIHQNGINNFFEIFLTMLK